MKAGEAMRDMIAHSAPAIGIIRDRLAPARSADKTALDSLIAQLGAPKFSDRTQAVNRLLALVDTVLPRLRGPAKARDAETRTNPHPPGPWSCCATSRAALPTRGSQPRRGLPWPLSRRSANYREEHQLAVQAVQLHSAADGRASSIDTFLHRLQARAHGPDDADGRRRLAGTSSYVKS